MTSIKVKVDKKGNIQLDFIGFNNNDCFKESDKLKQALALYGLELGGGVIIPKKNEQEIASEIDGSSREKQGGIKI
jgi:hypothetical protein